MIGYLSGQDGAFLPARNTGFAPESTQIMLCVLSHKVNPLLTKREVKMAGYWPRSFFARLWTQKKNEANIQPS